MDLFDGEGEVVFNAYFPLVFFTTHSPLFQSGEKILKYKQKCVKRFIRKSKGNRWRMYLPGALRVTNIS